MNGRRRAVLSMGLGLVMLGRPFAALADGPAADAASTPSVTAPSDANAAALLHYNKGKELYQAGSYREAIVEFDAARALDPKAKQLVYNLAIVHEKLGNVDEALRYARVYAQMDLEPDERTHIDAYIKRLEGAKTEVVHVQVSPTTPAPGGARPRGRFDAATVTVGVLAIGAAGVGAVFGVKALGDKVSAPTTGPGVTYQSLTNKQNTAHSEAVIADICFGGAVVAAAVAAGLYFGRYRDPDPATPAQSSFLVVTPLVGPTTGGLLLGGAF